MASESPPAQPADAPAFPLGQLLSTRRGAVLVLQISNPAARNALSPVISAAAREAIREASADPTLGAIVLAGDGEHFCGGGNLNRLARQRSLPIAGQFDSLNKMNGWVTAMRECPHPVIAAVEGAAAGAGCSLVFGCDLVVAASDAKFTMSHVKVGLVPDGGGTASLAPLVPIQTALEIALDGNVITPERLHQLGVVNRIVAPGKAMEEAVAWGERLARGPRQAQARIKRLMYAARTRSHRDQLDAEREAIVEALYGDEAGEGIAAFLEKRRPAFPR